MILRNGNTGEFEVYDISNNQITGAASFGSVGLEWQLGGFAGDPATGSMGNSGQAAATCAGNGRFRRRQRRSRHLEYCRVRCRRVAANVADVTAARLSNVRFSNRPFGVKRFQTIHHCSVDVAHGLVLLFGIGTKALPSWDSKTRWNNLWVGLAVRANGRSKRTCELTSSIVPRGTSFHRSVELEFPPIGFDPARSHAAAASLVQRNSVPSTQMRCMITASRRASATIAFFIPRRLAICIAQALSQDHFFERSMLWAAS